MCFESSWHLNCLKYLINKIKAGGGYIFLPSPHIGMILSVESSQVSEDIVI